MTRLYRSLVLIVLLLAASISEAQSPYLALPEGPAASAPTSGPVGRTYIVTNGSAPGDCTAGGGTFRTLCVFNGSAWSVPAQSVNADCAVSGTPAACGAATTGSVSIAAAATTMTVNTTAVTANSRIFVFEDSTLGTRLTLTCNTTTGRVYSITTRTAGTSFVITASAAPVTNPACLNFQIIN